MDFLFQNFDTVIKFIGVAAGAVAFFYALRNEITTLRVDVNHIKEAQGRLTEAFVQLGSILTKIAVQDVRINMIEKDVDELRHGKGIVN